MKMEKILIKLLTLWQKIKSCFIKKDDYETVRSRNVKGQFVADDPSTPDVNEAFVSSKRKK
jgi:hypothetical protein